MLYFFVEKYNLCFYKIVQILGIIYWTVNKVKYYMKKFKQKNILRYEGTSQNGK
ncbi:hypothetical protein HMPREF9108_00831 [Leptotrichia sp. oral taxon 225 str. F0581]|nr:hypothetical protein HMPREF9108_00831 [Leptotrichia sp. oral taxon 225 str. F0581]